MEITKSGRVVKLARFVKNLYVTKLHRSYYRQTTRINNNRFRGFLFTLFSRRPPPHSYRGVRNETNKENTETI